jgi:hypothetical protein
MNRSQTPLKTAALSLPRLPGLRNLVLECRAHPCRRFTVAHRLLRRDGIYLNDDWYCSAECLQDALHPLLQAAAQGCVEPRRRPGRLPFRLILVDRGVLSETRLQEAFALQAEHGGSLEEILMTHGLATEAQIASAKATECGCAVVSRLPAVQPGFDLPTGLMERYQAAIVYSSENCLLIGFVHRVAPALLQAAGEIAGIRAEFCFIAAGAFRRRLRGLEDTQNARETSDPPPSEMMEEGMSGADAAGNIIHRAVEAGAERVHIATGNQWAWARLSSEARRLDMYIALASKTTGGAHA